MKFPALFSAVSMALLLSACGNQGTADKTNATDSKSAPGETLRIATESNFRPFSYLDNQGNMVGFEIDLANALCDELKVTCDISSQDWDGLVPGLTANRFDALMAGISITPKRLETVDFTDPYFQNALVFVAKKDAPVTIKDVDGKNVATQIATVSAEYLATHHPKAVVKTYDNQDNAYLDLTAGRADYMLSDIVPMLEWLKSDAAKDFEIKGEPIDIDDSIAIATRKGDAWTARLNTALATLKQNGEYDKIVAKHFDAQMLAKLGVDTDTTAQADKPVAATEAKADQQAPTDTAQTSTEKTDTAQASASN